MSVPADIAALFAARLSSKDIAAKLNLDTKKVRELRREWKVEDDGASRASAQAREAPPTLNISADIAALFDERLPDKDIARRLGVAKSEVKALRTVHEWRSERETPKTDERTHPTATAIAQVRSTRVEFLEAQLVSLLSDMEKLREQRHSGTAVSVMARTIVDVREQLDNERHRLLEASGDPIEQMSADELVADIAEVIRELPDMLHDQIAAVVLERYGQEPELLLG